MDGQVAPQGIHPHLPEVLAAGKTAPPAGSGAAVEVPVWDRGAVADRAQGRWRSPGLRPGGFVMAWGTLTAGGQVGADQGDGGAGLLRRATAGAGAIAADVVDSAVQAHNVVAIADGDVRG